MNLIDIRVVLTQIAGFLLLVWAMRRWALGPLMGALEARREKIAADLREAERERAEAQELKASYEQKLRGADAEARRRIQDGVTEGQRVGAEVKTQAHAEAQHRLEQAQDEIAREREKAKELIKEQVVRLSIRTAEKILRQKLDDPAQRKLVGEFVDEVGALR
jgi:F-type H+-transporting ATPase subunit b